MDGITWQELFGIPYEQDLDPVNQIKVDLRKKKPAPLCPMIVSLKALLANAAVKAKLEGPGNGAVTPHTAGAALDIHYDSSAKDKDILAYAHGLISLFIKHRATLKFGVILYNQMQFTGTGVVAKQVGHTDHVHIDWIDYSTVKRSKAFTSFKYIDDFGTTQTKIVGEDDQKTEMRWNPGARGGTLTAFQVGFDELNSTFDSQKATLAGLQLADFQAMYAAAPPAPPQPPPPGPSPAPQREKQTDSSMWFDEDGQVVHPDAPAGRGGPGRFRRAAILSTDPIDDGLPHPRAPAARTLDPLAIQQFAKDATRGEG